MKIRSKAAKLERAALRKKKRSELCPRCKSAARSSKEYDDAWLHICRRCHYPVRELKP